MYCIYSTYDVKYVIVVVDADVVDVVVVVEINVIHSFTHSLTVWI